MDHRAGVGSTDDSAVRALLAKQEIHEVLMLYCRGVDRRDPELVESAFHPDAVTVQSGSSTSPAELAARIAGEAGGTAMMHFIGNEYVELDGDVAYSEAYFIAYSSGESPTGGAATRTRAGRYLDRFERRGGVWRIAHRTMVDEWSRIDDVHRTVPGLEPSGRQSRDDLVYRLNDTSKGQ